MLRMTVRFQPGFFFVMAAIILLLPISFVAAWYCAVFVHEFGHYLCVRICRKQVYRISIGATGALMETESMPAAKEFACSLAGPMMGFLLIFLSRVYPMLTLCAFAQSIFNLIPLFPLDGGRALRCVIFSFFRTELAKHIFLWSQILIYVGFVLWAMILSCCYQVGLWPLLTVLFLIIKVKSSCKECHQAVQ